MSTTSYTNADVDVGYPRRLELVFYGLPDKAPLSIDVPGFDRHTELVRAEDENGLVDLESEDLGLDEGERFAINLHEALSGFAVCDSGGSLLLAGQTVNGCRQQQAHRPI